jgi:hypothetical protein
MGWVLRLVEAGIDSPPRVIDVMDIRPLGVLGDIAKLGLTLSEAKQILARLQQVVVAVQAHAITRFCVRIALLAVMCVMLRTDGFIGWRHCLALCASRRFAAPAVAIARPVSVGHSMADPHPSSPALSVARDRRWAGQSSHRPARQWASGSIPEDSHRAGPAR